MSLPPLTYPTVRAVETAVGTGEQILDVDLTVSHDWLGDVFGYYGTFDVRRVYLRD